MQAFCLLILGAYSQGFGILPPCNVSNYASIFTPCEPNVNGTYLRNKVVPIFFSKKIKYVYKINEADIRRWSTKALPAAVLARVLCIWTRLLLSLPDWATCGEFRATVSRDSIWTMIVELVRAVSPAHLILAVFVMTATNLKPGMSTTM